MICTLHETRLFCVQICD